MSVTAHEAPARTVPQAFIFRELCRRKGTRMHDIMCRIESGENFKTIAKRYATDVNTIRVYEKALNNELADYGENGNGPIRWAHKDAAMYAYIAEKSDRWPWPDYTSTDLFGFDPKKVRSVFRARKLNMSELGRRAGYDAKFVGGMLNREKWRAAFLFFLYDMTGIDLIKEGAVWLWEK